MKWGVLSYNWTSATNQRGQSSCTKEVTFGNKTTTDLHLKADTKSRTHQQLLYMTILLWSLKDASGYFYHSEILHYRENPVKWKETIAQTSISKRAQLSSHFNLSLLSFVIALLKRSTVLNENLYFKGSSTFIFLLVKKPLDIHNTKAIQVGLRNSRTRVIPLWVINL